MYELLFSPIRIGARTLKDRLTMAPSTWATPGRAAR